MELALNCFIRISRTVECVMRVRTVAKSLAIIATMCGPAIPAHAVTCVGDSGAGTYVEIYKGTDFNDKLKFSNYGYTSQTKLLSGCIDNGATSDSIIGSREQSGVTNPDEQQPAGQALGKAAADLAAGTLSVFATSTGTEIHGAGGQFEDPVFVTVSQAGFQDTLTANEAGTMHFAIDISGTASAGGSDVSSSSYVDGGFLFLYSLNGQLYDFGGHPINHSPSEIGPFPCINEGQCSYSLDIPLEFGDLLTFALTLEIDAGNATGDFYHTLTLGVTGVGFDSASGVFLTDLTQVPEPPTFALFCLGLLALAAVSAKTRVAADKSVL
jgi:hypothetical protein